MPEDQKKIGFPIPGNYDCKTDHWTEECCFCKPNGVRSTQVAVWVPESRNAEGTVDILIKHLVASFLRELLEFCEISLPAVQLLYMIHYIRGSVYCCFSRMRSEGFPFIVGGLGVGAVFAWRASCRRLSSSLVVCRRLSSSLVVCRRLSSSSRLKFAAIGGSFCK